MRVVVRIVIVLLLFARLAEAQQKPGVQEAETRAKGSTETNRAVLPFLDGTDVFWTPQIPKEDGTGEQKYAVRHKLEANINPNLVFYQTFTDTVDLSEQVSKGIDDFHEFTYSFSGTPGVRLRMLFEPSSPVRTPSFTPRFNLQGFWTRGLKDCRIGSTRSHCAEQPDAAVVARRGEALVALERLNRFTLYEAHVTAGHYSNGQDGCLNRFKQRDANGDCDKSEAITAQNINTVNGSFSVDVFFRAGVNFTRNYLPDSIKGDVVQRSLQAVKEIRVHADVEYGDHRGKTDEGTGEPDELAAYGNWRFTGGGSLAYADKGFCKKRLEGSVVAGYYRGTGEGVTPWSVTSQVSCFPTVNGGWGVFARWHKGQDYYNVQFFENTSRFQVGFTYNQTGFLRFLKRPDSNGTAAGGAE
jgi:hypothetical protein